MPATKQPFEFHVAVLEGKPVTYVAHRKRDDWFVAGSGFVDEPKTKFRRVSQNVALQAVPELAGPLNVRVGFAAYRHRQSAPWTIEALPRGETYLITLEARPSTGNPDVGTIGGAFVNCWVRSPSLERAKRMARRFVRSNDWDVVRLSGGNRIRSKNLTKDMEPHFRQVQIDGLVCIFHTYPFAAPDEACMV